MRFHRSSYSCSTLIPSSNLVWCRIASTHRYVQCTDCFVVYFSFSNGCEVGVGDVSSKLNGLSFAELIQCVGVQNLQYSWEKALESYSYAAHHSLPPVSSKESHKVTMDIIIIV